MDLATAPVKVQLAAFEEMVLRNPTVVAVLERMPHLALSDCYLAAGAVFQTVWNCLSDRDPQTGIKDYDVEYFDGADLSWAAEDAAIQRGNALFTDLEARIEIRNEARVHLWYEDKFGIPCPPYTSTAAAINSFPTMSSAYGVRTASEGAGGKARAGDLEVYAPYGFADLFAFIARPNPVLAPRHVYEAKTARWQREWPRLTVLPWPVAD